MLRHGNQLYIPLIFFFILIFSPAFAGEYEGISLKNDDMVVTIIPATLEVRVNSSGTSVISEP